MPESMGYGVRLKDGISPERGGDAVILLFSHLHAWGYAMDRIFAPDVSDVTIVTRWLAFPPQMFLTSPY